MDRNPLQPIDARRSRAAGPVRRRAVEPTFFQRYECKYRVTPSVVPEIRRFLRPFATPDTFAARMPDLRYPICSLYLDSADLGLYRQTVGGEKDRFKLRVRTYGDGASDPAFFEVKRKVNSVVHKRRAGLDRETARRLLDGAATSLVAHESKRRDVDYFFYNYRAISARPVLRVRYQREAYEATGHEPVRITLDTELRYAVTFGNDLRHGTGDWRDAGLSDTIVEVKFTERFPWWVEDFVRRFGLNQRSVPKYVLSVDRLLETGARSPLSMAGFLLPPGFAP